MQDNTTENQETDQQYDFCFSARQSEDKMESHTEEVVWFLACVLFWQAFNLFL